MVRAIQFISQNLPNIANLRKYHSGHFFSIKTPRIYLGNRQRQCNVSPQNYSIDSEINSNNNCNLVEQNRFF